MPERLKVWQILFLVFPILVYLAYSSYVDFTHLEEEGGILYVGKTTKLLYELGGKWAVVGFPIVIMGLWGYGIFVTLKASRKVDELRDRAENPMPPSPAAETSKPPAVAGKPPRAVSQPPSASQPPAVRRPSGPITPLAASAPPAPTRADDVPPDPSGPKFLR
jgi:hypothetical protein